MAVKEQMGFEMQENLQKEIDELKKRKLKNSYCVPSTLKNKLPQKCKRLFVLHIVTETAGKTGDKGK